MKVINHFLNQNDGKVYTIRAGEGLFSKVGFVALGHFLNSEQNGLLMNLT